MILFVYGCRRNESQCNQICTRVLTARLATVRSLNHYSLYITRLHITLKIYSHHPIKTTHVPDILILCVYIQYVAIQMEPYLLTAGPSEKNSSH